ncbi:uncharacterized protein MELLADRAFT_95701 [Melampsora larici-populina 98AG31]|uniref:Uncharacterized protein n=1 Tax=Melampsora larici-populina (strain 98AG31 / pathotype 3-4-7) TaxID=747676 RepID=F4SAB3_MELLP|nr:uncharacterized protein MELLADRAFT_95701 [Melampsora larici-populina 98AG31]EGF98421.1 hypothetical protein MELLADRAFT_95701 [Melampsora larici-populina 98AG31]
MTTPLCGRCQWRQNNPKSGRCETPQCTSCGKCYVFLDESECPSCKKSNNNSGLSALLPPLNPPSSALATAPLGPNINTPSIASSLPQELFQGVLSQPSHPSTSFINRSRLDVPYGSQILNSQLQGSIRASQSGRRTVGKPKGRKTKQIEECTEEDSQEIEIPMSFLYLSGIGKSTIVHPLTPRKFKVKLNDSDWFWSLGWEVYAYYLKEAEDSAWPSEQLQRAKKIHPLPPDFSTTYCIIAENGISVSKESMESTIRKSKKLDNKKFGLIFNMQKYLATLKEASPEPENLKPTSRKRKQKCIVKVDEDDSTDELDELEDDFEQSSSRTQKRKQTYLSSESDEIGEIHSDTDGILNHPAGSQPSKGTQPILKLCVNAPDSFPGNESKQMAESSHGHDDYQDTQKLSTTHKDSFSVSVQTDQTLPIHDVLLGQLEHDESMSLESFGNTHQLAPSARPILPYPPRPIELERRVATFAHH